MRKEYTRANITLQPKPLFVGCSAILFANTNAGKLCTLRYINLCIKKSAHIGECYIRVALIWTLIMSECSACLFVYLSKRTWTSFICLCRFLRCVKVLCTYTRYLLCSQSTHTTRMGALHSSRQRMERFTMQAERQQRGVIMIIMSKTFVDWNASTSLHSCNEENFFTPKLFFDGNIQSHFYHTCITFEISC